MDRRNFLRAAGALAGLKVGCLELPAAEAATGYRALVAVMLAGGNDGMNTVVPLDSSRYDRYCAVRGSIALRSAADTEHVLGPIVPIGDGSWGLHPRLAALKPLADAGRLAHVANVGPLARPTTRADFAAWRNLNDADKLPEALFSHSDQQKLWQNGVSRTDGSSVGATGWGARLAERASAGLYSFAGNSRFGSGSTRSALILPGPGATMTGGLGAWQPAATWDPAVKLNAAFLTAMKAPNADPLFKAFARLRANALDAVTRLGGLIAATPGSVAGNAGIDAAFQRAYACGSGTVSAYATVLGKQLYQVAKLIAAHATVGGSRHIYFVQLGGFDTHGGQPDIQADLLSQVGIGLASFMEAIDGMGLTDSVTSFTLSDFGRTFRPNNTLGTDHAWGNTQLVLGGAVRGGAWGSYPELTLGGPDDAGIDSWEFQGRWIPTTSVDQYAATLGGWLGLGEAALLALLPNLGNFSVKRLGFMQV
ncbi:DUF1501 domain-containing protein [Derxia lacustris]|uniref:DUF1501 domain-containing protein n=1 Tax=Derxia lacustris TaxID=764842 RepID=UPI000A16F8EA|nr:DUF1501 domain-containing protein [Derxia lacustris]